jgi:Holliday junction resolvase RusA-like endonuclease
VKFTILGAPRTKSNHQRIGRSRNGKPFVMQAKTSVEWEQAAILQLQAQRHRAYGAGPDGSSPPFRHPLNLRALIYRDRATGDLGNFVKALCDALERAGIVENDRLIAGFDGSRLLVDKANPRVEIELSPMARTEAA